MSIILTLALGFLAGRLALTVRQKRRLARLHAALAEVESASPLVIADWPAAHLDELSCVLVREEMRRSAVHRQGMHTSVAARDGDYELLVRISGAVARLRDAGRVAQRAERRDAA